MPLQGPWPEEFRRIKQHSLDQIAQVDPNPASSREPSYGDLISSLCELVIELNKLNLSLTRMVEDFLEVPPHSG